MANSKTNIGLKIFLKHKKHDQIDYKKKSVHVNIVILIRSHEPKYFEHIFP